MPSQFPGILCCGNLVLDTLVRPVPEDPPWNASHWVESIEQHLGGNGANTAYAIGKLGVLSRVIGVVGSDPAASRILALLAEAPVDPSFLIGSTLPTPATVALVRADGARSLLHCPGASREAFLSPFEFTPALVRGCSRFHLGNPFGIPGLRHNAPEILRRARAAGLATSIDAGWDSQGEWAAVFSPCLPCVDVVFVNASEAFHLTGLSDPSSSARALLAQGPSCVVVKLGERGCAVYTPDTEHSVPGFSVPVLDTTGAGDCFAGAFLAALVRGFDLPAAARFANAAGALSVSALGSVTGLLSFDETLRWIEARS